MGLTWAMICLQTNNKENKRTHYDIKRQSTSHDVIRWFQSKVKHQRYDGYSVCRAHFDSNRSGTKLWRHILSFVYRFLVLVRVKISPQPMRTQLENNTGNWFTFEYFTVEMNKSGGGLINPSVTSSSISSSSSDPLQLYHMVITQRQRRPLMKTNILGPVWQKQ